jgi:hypothetical protein
MRKDVFFHFSRGISFAEENLFGRELSILLSTPIFKRKRHFPVSNFTGIEAGVCQGLRMTKTKYNQRGSTEGVPRHWNPVLFFAIGLMVICSAALALPVPMDAAACVLTQVDTAEAKNVEYQLKAAFLYNFMKFIEFPEIASGTENKESQKNAPITLCVLGTDFFGKYLDDLTKKEIKARTIRIVRLEGFEQYQKTHPQATQDQYFQEQKKALEGCHLLFISQSEEKRMSELVTLTDGMRFLTVSDISGFAKQGGVIEFVMEENKIRFDINVAAADQKRLKISSQLLQLARKIHKKTQAAMGPD